MVSRRARRNPLCGSKHHPVTHRYSCHCDSACAAVCLDLRGQAEFEYARPPRYLSGSAQLKLGMSRPSTRPRPRQTPAMTGALTAAAVAPAQPQMRSVLWQSCAAKPAVRVCRCAADMLRKVAAGSGAEVVVAGHNQRSIQTAAVAMQQLGLSPHQPGIHFAQLMGMCDCATYTLANNGYQVPPLTNGETSALRMNA